MCIFLMVGIMKYLLTDLEHSLELSQTATEVDGNTVHRPLAPIARDYRAHEMFPML